MRHLGQIRSYGVTKDVLAHRYGQHALALTKALGLEHFTQVDDLSLWIRNFDPDDRLPRQRCDNTNRHRTQRHCQIVGQAHDLVDLDARGRLVFVHSDHGSGMHTHHTTGHAEIRELLLEDLRIHEQRISIVLATAFGRRREDR